MLDGETVSAPGNSCRAAGSILPGNSCRVRSINASVVRKPRLGAENSQPEPALLNDRWLMWQRRTHPLILRGAATIDPLVQRNGAMQENAASLTTAKRLHREGRIDEAGRLCRAMLSSDPANAEALHLAGVIELQRGTPDTAIVFIERALTLQPDNAGILSSMGSAYRAANRLEEAERCYRRALEIRPSAGQTRFNLANLLVARGALADALAEYEAASRLDPSDVGTRNNLAIVLRRIGRLEDAAQICRDLIADWPRDAVAHGNLGVICMEMGRVSEAIGLYRKAVTLDPQSVETQNNLGVALLESGDFESAVRQLRKAADHADATADVHQNLGHALQKIGETDAAAIAYERALDDGNSGPAAIKLATLLPVVAGSAEMLKAARTRMADAVDRLLAVAPPLEDPNREVGSTCFSLSYHDTNNSELLKQVARLYCKSCPSLTYVAPHCRHDAKIPTLPLKVGFVSRHFATHAIGWCFEGVMRFLPREDVTVTAFRIGASDDPLWRRIASDVEETVILPANLAAARERIAAEKPDILIYTDLGMEPLTYFLAFSRLAPVQCVLGGHPDTTGIPNIDLYISSDMQEPADAAAHYSEELVRLPGAPTYYIRPEVPDPLKPRSAFGLPERGALYFCAQTLIKVHPDMDRLFKGILDEDPEGSLVFPGGYNPHLVKLLRRRLAETLGGHSARVHFLPTLDPRDFMNAMALADVSLDTRPFGGGNTSWQAIAAGTPIVTWPGRFLRGRYTQALYRLIDVEDTIVDSAEDYVSMAVRLGTDSVFRDAIRARVEAGSSKIFADETHLQALHRTLLDVGAGLRPDR